MYILALALMCAMPRAGLQCGQEGGEEGVRLRSLPLRISQGVNRPGLHPWGLLSGERDRKHINEETCAPWDGDECQEGKYQRQVLREGHSQR